MGYYTPTVRQIVESYYYDKHKYDDNFNNQHTTVFDDVNKMIGEVHSEIFDFTYPYYSPKEKSAFELKFLRHFYMREIGFETLGLFKLQLENRMNEIMPYYNKMYLAAQKDFDIFENTNYTETGTIKDTGQSSDQTDSGRGVWKTTDGTHAQEYGSEMHHIMDEQTDKKYNSDDSIEYNSTDKTTDIATNKNTERNSDTPQGTLQNVENNSYLSSATITDSNINDTTTTTHTGKDTAQKRGNDTTTVTGTNTDAHSGEDTLHIADTEHTTDEFLEKKDSIFDKSQEHDRQTKGKQGGDTYSEMLEKYYHSLRKIDQMVYDDCNDLFMALWE